MNHRLNNLKQKKDDTIQQFADRIYTTIENLYGSYTEKREYVDIFILGLKDKNISDQLREEQIDNELDMKEAIEIAFKLTNLRSRRNKKKFIDYSSNESKVIIPKSDYKQNKNFQEGNNLVMNNSQNQRRNTDKTFKNNEINSLQTQLEVIQTSKEELARNVVDLTNAFEKKFEFLTNKSVALEKDKDLLNDRLSLKINELDTKEKYCDELELINIDVSKRLSEMTQIYEELKIDTENSKSIWKEREINLKSEILKLQNKVKNSKEELDCTKEAVKSIEANYKEEISKLNECVINKEKKLLESSTENRQYIKKCQYLEQENKKLIEKIEISKMKSESEIKSLQEEKLQIENELDYSRSRNAELCTQIMHNEEIIIRYEKKSQKQTEENIKIKQSFRRELILKDEINKKAILEMKYLTNNFYDEIMNSAPSRNEKQVRPITIIEVPVIHTYQKKNKTSNLISNIEKPNHINFYKINSNIPIKIKIQPHQSFKDMKSPTLKLLQVSGTSTSTDILLFRCGIGTKAKHFANLNLENKFKKLLFLFLMLLFRCGIETKAKHFANLSLETKFKKLLFLFLIVRLFFNLILLRSRNLLLQVFIMYNMYIFELKI